MCGIVGMVGDFVHTDVEIFRKLLFLDTIRGDDSTGVAAISLGSSVTVVKDAVPGYEFIRTKEYNDAVHSGKLAIIGHNRAATMGTVKPENAHPFQHKHITGVHNGTLNHGYENHLFEKIPARSFQVDSEHIYYAMSVEETKEVLRRTHGAMALVWHNAREHTLNFIRNDKRPLYYIFSADRKKMFFLSEPSMFVTAVSETRGANFEAEGKFALFEENMLYTLPLPRTFAQKLPDFERESVATGSVFKVYTPAKRQSVIEWDYESIYTDTRQRTGNVIQYSSPKQAQHAAGPSKNNKNQTKYLPVEKRVQMSKKYWENYTDSSNRRGENQGYQKYLRERAASLKRDEVIKEFAKYHRLTDELMDMFHNAELIPNTKEYEPIWSKRICDAMTAIDYTLDILRYWESNATKAGKATVFHQVKEKIRGFDPASIFPDEKPKLILPDTIPTKEESTEAVLPELNELCGLGNLTHQDFKNIVKNQGCDHCSAQDVTWEPTSCYLTASRQLICPDCVTTENVQTMIAEGMIKLA